LVANLAKAQGEGRLEELTPTVNCGQ
jgi:hypothetical protein